MGQRAQSQVRHLAYHAALHEGCHCNVNWDQCRLEMEDISPDTENRASGSREAGRPRPLHHGRCCCLSTEARVPARGVLCVFNSQSYCAGAIVSRPPSNPLTHLETTSPFTTPPFLKIAACNLQHQSNHGHGQESIPEGYHQESHQGAFEYGHDEERRCHRALPMRPAITDDGH